MILNKRGFTLIELLVVLGLIATLMAALTVSISGAQERARIQKASSEVKVISQAILAYENYSRGGKFQLEPVEKGICDQKTLGFLLGKGENADSGGQIPVLLMQALSSGGKMLDPWGSPYMVTIRKGDAQVKIESANSELKTGFLLPNFYRLSASERK